MRPPTHEDGPALRPTPVREGAMLPYAVPLSILVDALKNRQRDDWHAGRGEPVERLFDEHPDLRDSPEAFSLVYGEYLLREETGGRPSLNDYLQRFPQFAPKLEEQVRLHGALAGTSWWQHGRAPDADTPLEEPAVAGIPGYELLKVLGRGGMGVVYRARQASLDRVVALKMMLGGAFAGPQFLARFRAEAEAVAHLDHPNIVPVYDVGECQGQPYFTMKLVEGGSLAEHARAYHDDQRAAARLVAEVARAVDYAHRRGILHRDLKPSNVLLDLGGKPYVTDFGLAKRVDSSQALTGTNACVGTPGYLAPEQAAGQRALTVAVDIWGLGTILYELLTRTPPYAADTPLKAMQEVLDHDPRRPKSLVPTVDPDLETVCLRCLAREPERRYPSALALAEDLERWLAGEPIHARPAGRAERAWRWARRRPAVAALSAAVVLVALLGVAGVLAAWLHALDGWERAEDSGYRADRERLSAERRRDEAEGHLYFSRVAQAGFEERLGDPDSAARLLRLCVPADAGDAEHRHWEWHYLSGLLNADLLTLSHPHEDIVYDVAFSPDGTRLVTAGGSPYRPLPPDRICVWDVWGANAGRLVAQAKHSRFIRQARYQRDGRAVVWVGEDNRAITVTAADDGRTLKTLPLPDDAQAVTLSPDGSRCAYRRRDGKLHVLDVATGIVTAELPAGRVNTWNLAFSADASLLAVSSEEGITLRSISTPRELCLTLGGPLRSRPAFSADGTLLAAGLDGGVVSVWDTATGRPTLTLAGAGGDVLAAAFAPDGQTLATTGADRTVRLWSLKTARELLRLRGHQGRGMCLSFHPSGRYLASGAGQPSEVKLWDLTRQQEHLTIAPPPAGRRVEALAFAADGGRLLITRSAGMLQSADAASGADVALHKLDLTAKLIRPAVIAAFSPGAKTLATVSNLDTSVVNLLTPDGQHLHRLPHPAEVKHLAFDRAGARLAVSAPAAQPSAAREIKVWDVATGSVLSTLTCDPFVDDRSYGAIALSPDGALLAHDEATDGLDRAFRVTVRDARTGEVTARVPGAYRRVERIVFSPDGTLLALSCEKRGVLVYDLAHQAWRHGEPLQGSTNANSLETFWDLAFSPDGQRLAAVNRVQLVLWDVAGGRLVTTLRGAAPPSGDNGFNPRVAWSPDGRRLAASNSSGSVSLWDASDRSTPAAKTALHAAAENRPATR